MFTPTYTVADFARDAHEIDLRNRMIPFSADDMPSSDVLATNVCAACPNLLTITDTGRLCWQCHLAEHWDSEA